MTTPEISKAQASEYEHIFLIDKSGSMGSPSRHMPGKTLWQESKEPILSLITFLRDVDENGIDIILFGSDVTVYRNIKTPEEVENIFKEVSPGGRTNLAGALREAEKIRASTPGAMYFWHCLTDGVPDSEEAVADAIATSVRTMKADKQLAISFMQVGDDPDATAFLKRLDDDLQTKMKLQFDAVNTLSTKEAEGLKFEQVMWLAVND